MQSGLTHLKHIHLGTTTVFPLCVFRGCYMASPFIIDDSYWMLTVYENKHFSGSFARAWQLHFVFLLPFPPKASFALPKDTCYLLEAQNYARPWGFKRKRDRYSWRGLVSLQCLLKILNSLIDSLVIQSLFSLSRTLLSSHNLAVTKTETLMNLLEFEV